MRRKELGICAIDRCGAIRLNGFSVCEYHHQHLPTNSCNEIGCEVEIKPEYKYCERHSGVEDANIKYPHIHNIAEPKQTFQSGAQRGTDRNNVRYDLICPTGMRRIAETYAEGAKKYSDVNWCKGIPIRDMLNHAIAHLNLWSSGDTSEDHLAHAAWNLISIMHYEERCAHHLQYCKTLMLDEIYLKEQKVSRE